MASSFLVYIDESGDDGLSKFRMPGASGGASTWLAISACVFRHTHNLDAVSWRDEITNLLMPEKQSRILHFKDLNHSQRVVAAQCLSNKPVRLVTVISNKTTIPPETYNSKNQLYFYLTRYLIERVSWLCRDLRKHVPEGDGRAEIVFSRRGGMSYRDFSAYLKKLKNDSHADVRIHWPVINIEGIDAQDHSKSASLQLADIAASAFTAGFELDRYGNTEKRYAELLKKVTYNRGGNYLSYGLKIIPQESDMKLLPQQTETINLFR